MLGWSIADGGFESHDGRLIIGQADSGKAVQGVTFDDVTLPSIIDVPKGDGNAGVIFRATSLGSGPDNYHGYYAGIDPSDYVVLGRANGGWLELGRHNLDDKGYSIYTPKVKAVGDLIQVYVDNMNTPKIEVHNGDFRSGANGFRVYHHSATAYSFSAIAP